ncbi:pleckstrin homology domain-containing family A member 1-like isoform X2 [Pomacea canaliculata]|uniref:pleckstrin homology domain-containing family A member 1-like isoform X2 n=1 Tax=Pomacea canaliculata TaxID=400727 RepID=UPI000D735740|nr:pleckstrin homology domain-containing family A member 1-like isoform X2 [Pomacea canaliculata]
MPHPDRDGRLCGFLNIEETEMSGSFYRRYFILDSANRKFAYYMDSPLSLPESWRNPVGEIYLQYINKVGDARKMRPKVPHCFVVSVAGRQYFLQAEDDHSMEEWIEALNNASKITVPRHERTYQGTEWHAGDLSQTGYVTEIIGGVVCKMPMQMPEDVDSETEDDESRSSSSGKISPSSSVSRHLNALGRECSSAEHHKPITSNTVTPIRAGYAVKQGAVRKSWKRRYFILHEQGLSYFKAEHDKHAIRTIHTVDILEAKQAEGTNLNRDNLFELITSKRIFYIQCDSPADMQGWIDAVRLAVRTRKLEERKSMQEAEGGQHVEPDLGHTYPDPIWRSYHHGD